MGAYPAAKKTSEATAPAATVTPVTPAFDGGWCYGLGLAFLLFLILILLVLGFGFLFY
jgi:hypothetical protein